MNEYIDKELADAMEVLRRNCDSRDCIDCCFNSDKGCYLHRKAVTHWRTDSVVVAVQKYKLKED